MISCTALKVPIAGSRGAQVSIRGVSTATEAGGRGDSRMKRFIIPGLTTNWKYPRPPPRVTGDINTAMKMMLRFTLYRPRGFKTGLQNPAPRRSSQKLMSVPGHRGPGFGLCFLRHQATCGSNPEAVNSTELFHRAMQQC